MAKKLKKAILAGLTAYAGSKMLGEKQKSDWIKKHNAEVRANRLGKIAEGTGGPVYKHVTGDGKVMEDAYKPKVYEHVTGDGKVMEDAHKPKHFKPSKVPGEKKKGWFSWWDGSGIGFRSKGGSVKSYRGGGAIHTKLNGKVKFRTY